ncbi:FMN-binding protein [candidate division KSB1 bacterium]|nr:FMN-binding protein [candidate division KSB1 bacterium]
MHFITESSAIPKVDSAFNQLICQQNLPVNASGCADGVFTGESPYDAYDYKHIVEITIKNEKIVAVEYDEINRDGHGKQTDKSYCKEMSSAGTTPALAYPIIEQQLADKQDINGVDMVSGASYSLYRFRYAVMIALMKARLAAVYVK